MATAGNARLALAISTLFESETDSDCFLVFCQEESLQPQRSTGRKGRASSVPASKKKQKIQVVSIAPISYGDPMPVHALILRNVSERFKAQFERWAEGAEPTADPSQPSTGPKPRPVLRVPLGSEAEVHSARAAIRFAYTGQVEAGSIREVLEVRRQGAYLQIEGCAAACDELIKDRIESGRTILRNTSSGGVGNTSREGEMKPPVVLELYACEDLWPDSTAEASFAAVLTAAKPLLVRYFGDTLATLNTALLRQQLLALPAVAMEAVLESDDFGTDCESSVLLLLATWMEVNHSKTDAATRQRLCRHVRLVQLSKPYMLRILPLLAHRFEMSPGAPAGWFPISFGEATFLSDIANACELEESRLRSAATGVYDLETTWYNIIPRRQCLPPTGRIFNWSISQQQLQQALDSRQAADKCAQASGTFDGPMKFLTARGFLWHPIIYHRPRKMAAGLHLGCKLPSAYAVVGLQPGGSVAPTCVASIGVVLSVHAWKQDGSRQDIRGSYRGTEVYVTVGRNWGWRKLLPLRQSPVEVDAGSGGGADGGSNGGDGGGGISLAAWVDYLREGKMAGTLTMLPPLM